MKKFTRLIKENIENVNIFLEQNKNKYLIDIDEKQFNNILNERCKNYFGVSKSIKFYRGDLSFKNDYYILNAYNTIPKWSWRSMNLYPSLLFYSSHYWTDKNLPLKKNSADMVSDIYPTTMYGETYEVILLDNPQIVCNNELFGGKPPKIFNELFEELNISHISVFFDDIFEGINLNAYNEEKVIDYINKINNEFNTKNFILLEESRYKYKILEVMEKNNMSFIELMEYAFSPDNYEIYNYKDITKCNFETIFAYTNGTLLLRKINKKI